MKRQIPADGGPHIVVIGGGTGLSTMLRGLKYYSRNITAIVTVADDGGGSGVLRQELGILPPGDLRNCIQALSNVEPMMQKLLAYRFQDGSLTGQSFGNLLLAALNGICPSFETAVEQMNNLLAVTGRVIPVTDCSVDLVAEFENGTSVKGESKIFDFKHEQQCRIRRVYMDPPNPEPLESTIQAIREADVIILGPGSLYTSVIPNLLVQGVPQAVAESQALRIYVANIMTQVGETEGYTLSEHLDALLEHGQRGMVDVCLANDEKLPEHILSRYRTERSVPMLVDRDAVEAMGVELICRPLTNETCEKKARHSPLKLADAIFEIVEDRCVRTWTKEGVRYIRER